MTISCFCFCFAGVCSTLALFCQESNAFLRCCQVQGLQGSPCLSLSTRLMSSPMPLAHYLLKQPLPSSAQKEARQRARGFLCAFRHFLSRFSKYFLPHVSTLFNVVHGRVFAWREGGWGGVARRDCVHQPRAKTDPSKLSANE